MLLVNGNTLQQVEKFKYLVVLFMSDGRRNKELMHGLMKQTQFCVSFIPLLSKNGSIQTPQSCLFLNRSWLRSSPVVMNLG